MIPLSESSVTATWPCCHRPKVGCVRAASLPQARLTVRTAFTRFLLHDSVFRYWPDAAQRIARDAERMLQLRCIVCHVPFDFAHQETAVVLRHVAYGHDFVHAR